MDAYIPPLVGDGCTILKVLNTTVLSVHLKVVKMVNFILCIFTAIKKNHPSKKKKKKLGKMRELALG